MNTINNPLQSDTKLGEIQLPSNTILSGLEGRLLKVINNSGTPEFSLPGGFADLALWILSSGAAAAASPSAGEAPFQGGNARVLSFGNIVAGNILTLASCTANAGAQAGMVVAFPSATPGLYFSPGVSEESAAAGGLVKFRPCPQLLFVPPALNSVQNATTAAVDLPTSEALANALKANYNALQADVAAIVAAISGL
jgi:hypothetical protein